MSSQVAMCLSRFRGGIRNWKWPSRRYALCDGLLLSYACMATRWKLYWRIFQNMSLNPTYVTKTFLFITKTRKHALLMPSYYSSSPMTFPRRLVHLAVTWNKISWWCWLSYSYTFEFDYILSSFPTVHDEMNRYMNETVCKRYHVQIDNIRRDADVALMEYVLAVRVLGSPKTGTHIVPSQTAQRHFSMFSPVPRWDWVGRDHLCIQEEPAYKNMHWLWKLL